MKRVPPMVLALFLCGTATFALGGDMSLASSSSPMIALDETVHFARSDGGDLAILPGRYQVEQTESQLLFVGSDGMRLTVEATPLRHQQEIEAQQAFVFRIVPDHYQIVLLLADGHGWAAQGSAGEVRSRGTGLSMGDQVTAMGGFKALVPSERELLQEVLIKLDAHTKQLDALAKQVAPVGQMVPQIAQQVNDLENGKMGSLFKETNYFAFWACKHVMGASRGGCGPTVP